jgi:hypothetical protein
MEEKTGRPKWPSPPEPARMLADLHTVAGLLRADPKIGREEQRFVAELVDELAKALESPQPAAPELTRLTEQTAQMLEALRHRHDANLFTAARMRLDEAIMEAEERAPVVVGLVRGLLDVLAASGI